MSCVTVEDPNIVQDDRNLTRLPPYGQLHCTPHLPKKDKKDGPRRRRSRKGDKNDDLALSLRLLDEANKVRNLGAHVLNRTGKKLIRKVPLDAPSAAHVPRNPCDQSSSKMSSTPSDSST